MTSEPWTRRLKYIRRRPLYYNPQWNRNPTLLSSRANLCGTAPLNSTSTAAETATEVLGRRLTPVDVECLTIKGIEHVPGASRATVGGAEGVTMGLWRQ